MEGSVISINGSEARVMPWAKGWIGMHHQRSLSFLSFLGRELSEEELLLLEEEGERLFFDLCLCFFTFLDQFKVTSSFCAMSWRSLSQRRKSYRSGVCVFSVRQKLPISSEIRTVVFPAC